MGMEDLPMSWKETCAMKERMQFVLDAQSGRYSMSALCRRYGISRPCGYKWLERFVQEGLDGLKEKSRAPHTCPHRLDDELESLLVLLRRQNPDWGPRKLVLEFAKTHPDVVVPAPSTVGDMFKRRGISVPRKKRCRATPSAQPFESCDAPNKVWCADFKGWFRTLDGTRCDPFTMTDAYSRYLIRCQICEHTGYDTVRDIMEAAFREFGLPEAIRTDNGAPFASVGLGGLSQLSVWLLRLRIHPERIRPGNPQENGRHERFHRTLKAATLNPPARTRNAQQKVFDDFRHKYNEKRPHEALSQQTPASVYTYSQREYPARLPEPDYPDWMMVRRVDGGRIKMNSERVFLSKVLDEEAVGLASIDSRYSLVFFTTELLGVIDHKQQRALRVEQAHKRIPDLQEAITTVLRQWRAPLGEQEG